MGDARASVVQYRPAGRTDLRAVHEPHDLDVAVLLNSGLYGYRAIQSQRYGWLSTSLTLGIGDTAVAGFGFGK
jgi:hypothetical protein